MKIADFSIKHPKIILMVLIVLLVFGVLAAFSLNRNLIANLSLPTVVVVTTWPGVGPADIEREVTDPLEDALGTLTGLKQMTSVSRNSVSIITLELDYNEETDRRIPEIREKINGVTDQLPSDIPAPPSILQYSTDLLPVMTILVEGEGSRSELSKYCKDELIPTLSRVPGVAQVNMNGDSRDVVEITADMDRIRALRLSLPDISRTISASNVSLPGGDGIYHGYSLNIRTEGRYESLRDIEDQVLAFRDGQYIRLKDAAEVAVREDRRTNYVIADGNDSLVLSVIKQSDGDSIAISGNIREALGKIEAEHAGGLSFVYLKDDSENISMSINSVIESAVMGAILAVVILFIFLHNRNTTFIVGLSIPLCILFALIGLWAKGSSLDLMTLGGLTAAIGMIVDCSIVVLENVQRHFDAGMDRKKAASLGTDEVGMAVVASTTTTLAAFFPLLFITGLAGLILKDVAWTIIFALFSSMLVAIIAVPFLCSLFLKKDTKKTVGTRIARRVEGFMSSLTQGYQNLLRGALANRRSFLLGTFALLVLSILSFRLLGFEFLAQTDMAELEIDIETPGGYTLEMTRDKVLRLDEEIKRILPDEVESSYFVVGQSGSFGSGVEHNRAYGTLKLTGVGQRKRHVTEIINQLQHEIPRIIPDINASFRNGGVSNLLSMATGGEGFVVNVYGNSMDTVIAAAEQVQEYMARDPNVVDTDINIRFNQQEMTAKLLHQYLGTMGLSSYEAAMTNRIVFNGVNLGTFYGEDDNYPIELRTSLSNGEIPQDVLYGLSLGSPEGSSISYATFAELRTGETMSSISHRNKSRSLTVSAALRDPNVRETSRRVQDLLSTRGLVPGASWEIGGTTAEMLSSFQSLAVVLSIAVFLVYTVMVIQFERFTQPLLVMSSIPFTMIGVSAGLLIFGSSLSIVSLLGIVALAGVVVNNGIVLIDYINLLRDRDKMPLEEAVLTGAASRLKPILMTTLTTLLGIIPLAIGTGEGSEIYSPLGQSIFGGLFSSTFITLFFIPVIYLITEKRRERKQLEKSRETGESGGGIQSDPEPNPE
ncbi:efflux RND transporter permease subunit [Breznakiella homolactica]|uniref:Efflux RND transporter permease subunit n=1 Tax=Breznakiella homolactica TaxID=2798577 RepID=A0A7T7XPQ5_9SPIR|nr:efflux RND transporter permease subunit [Breznakiella homolactica]QQO10123.1 efflux RND transporter permease subunit [Breznakiella homolactica]